MALSKILPASRDQSVDAANLVINGAMTVHQRGGTITAGSSGNYSLDRWQIFDNGDGGFDVTQSTEAPVGFKNSLKVDVTSADTAIDAAAYKLLFYNFEGYDMSHLEWGTANAKNVTISFWVRSTTTGDHSVGIRGGNSSYNAYMTTYNISAANTWEYKTVTIPGDTTASFTYNSNNTQWGTLAFSFATGSTYTVTANETFEAGNLFNATGAVNLFSSDANDWYITGVCLNVGDQAPANYPHRSYGEELARCQRYYQQWGPSNEVHLRAFAGAYTTGVYISNHFLWPTIMRANPSFAIPSGPAYQNAGSWGTGNVSTTGVTLYSVSTGTNVIAGFYIDNNSSDYAYADAEL